MAPQHTNSIALPSPRHTITASTAFLTVLAAFFCDHLPANQSNHLAFLEISNLNILFATSPSLHTIQLLHPKLSLLLLRSLPLWASLLLRSTYLHIPHICTYLNKINPSHKGIPSCIPLHSLCHLPLCLAFRVMESSPERAERASLTEKTSCCIQQRGFWRQRWQWNHAQQRTIIKQGVVSG